MLNLAGLQSTARIHVVHVPDKNSVDSVRFIVRAAQGRAVEMIFLIYFRDSY